MESMVTFVVERSVLRIIIIIIMSRSLTEESGLRLSYRALAPKKDCSIDIPMISYIVSNVWDHAFGWKLNHQIYFVNLNFHYPLLQIMHNWRRFCCGTRC